MHLPSDEVILHNAAYNELSILEKQKIFWLNELIANFSTILNMGKRKEVNCWIKKIIQKYEKYGELLIKHPLKKVQKENFF